MIPFSSYHNHCTYDDGKDSAAQMLSAAEQGGFIAIGFSSHSPLPWHAPWTLQLAKLPQYIEEIRHLQRQSTKVQVYLALELDYLGERYNYQNWHPDPPALDYLVGSVHGFIVDDRFLTVDGHPDELRQLARHFGGIEQLVRKYFDRVAEMAEFGGIDVIAHFDLIKKNFTKILMPGIELESQSWYREAALSSLARIAACATQVEVSTALVSRSNRDELYPSKWLLPQLSQLHIPVVINSDAHATTHLGVYHQQAAELLHKAGFRSVRMLLDNRWQDVVLEAAT